ncbi:MAG TPA: hypothetical protein VN282_16740 [Pyrinomonadaceae bacterium]|nr:hypothetical protein [Pyrinomonadaceae bacterium]
MKSIQRIAALVALLAFGVPAAATTTLPLNTGYNYTLWNQYAAPGVDNYWINIASFPTTNPAVAPAFVIQPHPAWFQGPFAAQGGAWISAWNTYNSQTQIPAYTLFRKCFCLTPGFKNASMKFTVRADDNITVWFNTMTNQLVAPQQGHFAGNVAAIPAGTNKGFNAGKNCVYALVEDQFGVAMGFLLDGSVTADGLLPSAAAGVGQSFAPCQCQGGPAPGAAGPRDALDRRAAQAAEREELETVNAIIKYAEARRLERQRQRQ